MTTSLTAQDVAALRDILTSDSTTADRGGFYLAYYEMIKDIDAEAARQVLMQAHISTYSGFFGGAALLGNALANWPALPSGQVYPSRLTRESANRSRLACFPCVSSPMNGPAAR